MTSKRNLRIVLPAGLLLFMSCGGPTAPSPGTSTSALSPPTTAPEEPTVAAPTGAVDVFDCGELEDIAVRFSAPGFIRGLDVQLYVNYTGVPAGEKVLRVWWNQEHDATRFQDLSLGQGEVQRHDDNRFDIEALLEHTYDEISKKSEVVVRAELIIKGRPGNCARNRRIVVTPPARSAGSPTACSSLRFCSQGDGTVRDTKTGLLWLENPSCFGPRRWPTATSNTAALANGQCGLSDGSGPGQWRLPTESELRSLLDPRFSNPALSNAAGNGQWSDGDAFRGVRNRFYWTSDTVATCLGQLPGARIVHFGDGRARCRITSLGFAFSWPVR